MNEYPFGAVSTRVVGTYPNPITKQKAVVREDVSLSADDVMTLTEVSEWLGISEDDIRKMVRTDVIPAFHPAKNHFFFSRRDILSWLDVNRRGRISKSNIENTDD